MKMNAGYWKLWHDTSGRFYVSLLILTALLFLTLVPALSRPRPVACYEVAAGTMSWSTRRDNALQAREEMRKVDRQLQAGTLAKLTYGTNPQRLIGEEEIADGNTLSAHCAANERPNIRYGVEAQLYTRDFVSLVWEMAMPYLMLVIGILLSVGPPFSGESMEAFALTFSLPWTRERWLVSKMALATGLSLVLILFMLVVSGFITHFQFVADLRAAHRYGPPAIHPNAWHVIASVLAAFVGVSLGTAASMYTRNMLSATVLAGIVAYFLVSFDFIELRSYDVMDRFGNTYSSMLDSYGLQPLIVIGLISGLLFIARTRLRNTDF
jgi:hypothetical protein